jgi:REP element-mobilizing transposase RayT
VNETFLYVLAVAAERFGMLVHAFCVLSNHFHLVLTDPDAHLPQFEQYLNSLVARAVNASLGRWEAFWAPSSYSAVALTSAEDVVAKMAYVLANPVAAGLVRHGEEWPGLWSRPETIGAAPLRVSRPKTFFSPTGYMPEVAELQLTLPPGFVDVDELRARVAEELATLEDKAARDLKTEGRAFLGAAKVLGQKPTARPGPGEPRRKLSPRVAGRDRWKRIEALSRLVEFLSSYREAWRARREGKKGFLFPAGTYLLRIAHGVPCAAAA